MALATLVAFLVDKPSPLAALLGELIEELGHRLGGRFRPYDLAQIHATLIGLEARGATAIDLEELAAHVRRRLGDPLRLRFGGFAPGERPFTSRGRTPYERSFSLQADKAVLVGWPVAGGTFPDRLDALRRQLQRFGAKHTYHVRPEDVDNDAYLRLGFVPADLELRRRVDVEAAMRDWLAVRPPVEVELGVRDAVFAVYEQPTLPSSTTRVVPLDDPLAARRVHEILAGGT